MPFCSTFACGSRLIARAEYVAGGRREAGGRLRLIGQQKMPICRMFSTGATGLEPATSGVTGLFHEYDDWRRLTCYRSIDAALRALAADLRKIA
jgi:hypothetical protein